MSLFLSKICRKCLSGLLCSSRHPNPQGFGQQCCSVNTLRSKAKLSNLIYILGLLPNRGLLYIELSNIATPRLVTGLSYPVQVVASDISVRPIMGMSANALTWTLCIAIQYAVAMGLRVVAIGILGSPHT